MRINQLLAAGLCASGLVAAQSAFAAPLQALAKADTHATVAAAAAQDVVEFGVYLPLRHKQKLEALIARQHDEHSPQYRQWL